MEGRLHSPQETKPNLDIRIFNQSGDRSHSQMSSGDEMNLFNQSGERSQSRGVEMDKSGNADSQSKDIPEDLSMGGKEEEKSERNSIEN